MNSSWSLSTVNSQISNASVPQTLSSPASHKVNPKALKPHSRNSSIYGEDEDVSELIELICQSGWVKPLVINSDNVIISGHRRWKAVLALGWESVAVEVRKFPDELAELEALLLENASRLKTTEQKVREGFAWRELEASRAKIRQTAHLKIGNHTPVRENFPTRERGRVSDALASRVGLGSGRTYSKAAKVVTQIDEEASLGYLEIAQALRKVLNEQSVDAAHMLMKKFPQERHAIANLIVSGEAKSIKQAEKMLEQNSYVGFNDPSQGTLAGFSVGDWVEVNDTANRFKTYIGSHGQVELLVVVEQQLSVNFDGDLSKARFYPYELTLIAKATPPCPYTVGDIVFVDIDRHEPVSPQEKKWNGFWGKVKESGERGSLKVDVGKESLQLFPRDLKPVDAPSIDLRQVVERVLRLRSLELDEIESKMLDVIQLREWFTPKQLIHLENIEKLYPPAFYCHPETSNEHNADLLETEKRQVASV